MSTANDRCIQRPYKATGDTSADRERWYVDVPAVDYIREAFFGAISTLGFPDSYNPISDVAAEYGSEIGASLTQIVPPEEVTVPGLLSRVTLWHTDAEVTVNDAGNPIANTLDAAQLFGHYAQQSAPTLNSQSSQRVQLQKGSWSMRMLYFGNSQSGKCQLYWLNADNFAINGTIGADLDMYADGYNQIHTGTFTIPADGNYRIIWGNTGRNGANSSPFYRMMITKTELWRTGI